MHCASSRSSLHFHFCLLASSLGALAAALIAGCGGGSVSTTLSSQAVTIAVQPLSQTVPLGSTATFTVAATGAAPLTYQWSENGVPISGATSASYTTPSVALSDTKVDLVGSFQVSISNASGSVTSNAATLTAGPRSPKAGDLRYLLYQQVDLPRLGLDGGVATELLSMSNSLANNSVGNPLTLGSSSVCVLGIQYDCSWGFNIYSLPPQMTGLNMLYQSGKYSNFSSDLQAILASNVVISSLGKLCTSLRPASLLNKLEA